VRSLKLLARPNDRSIWTSSNPREVLRQQRTPSLRTRSCLRRAPSAALFFYSRDRSGERWPAR
jgi:hypothetical protein